MTNHEELRDQLDAVKADNARLRRLLDGAGAPDSLRHALRDTAAMLRSIIRRTTETRRDVADYAAHLDGRLDAIVRVRTRTDAYGEADLHSLIADELTFHLAHEGEHAALDGPRVRLRPRAAQVFALAVHELATNAVEHGLLSGSRGRVEVTWRVEPSDGGPLLVLVWKETGANSLIPPSSRGFGMTVLEEMLAYEGGAQAAAAFEPDGVRWTIRLPLVPEVGHLAEE
ncbi:HWE histidine kinase domain-containing protein [Methylobacterium gnaphalii]|uniref:histidine kinase n=1 Tax=Methylobacterium gnaphalii TaxID=1010610 RepID=A0A512JHL3_9HYPH|nr:HWE histidine kinase domain-containing protein [Methylobacterium gnaphalii]GEP09448.1 hypothetical protein MGN01_12930 [Methylobacterium gnaphalii]GJD68071.1 Blue-light-activated histidine kinase 1 [Methylobacterium gnaphalii]GLS49163.1 hypothetical protein GCM10007885_20110 [Methylobacterium gnaphalii]